VLRAGKATAPLLFLSSAYLDKEAAMGNRVHPASTASPGSRGATAISQRLYNHDLAPTREEGRTWSGYNIFALWANDVHSLGSYGFALGLFALGLGGWQILLSLGIGAVFLFVLLTLSGITGHKIGVPFPVLSRIAFGIRGAQLAAVIRGFVAIVWFGIQTYLATLAMRVMLIALWPQLSLLDANSILGLSTLGWASFLALWAVQMVIARYGMETIRHYEAYSGPITLITFIGLAGWVLVQTEGQIAWKAPLDLSGGMMWHEIFAGAALWVAIYGTFLLNYCDFTRSSKSRAAIVGGNFWGILLNVMFFACLTVIFAGGGLELDGYLLDSPADLVASIPNTPLLVAAGLALLIMTVAVNLMANFPRSTCW
jgi:NCS1 family nucleobase:cation symporter-1